MPKGSSKTRRPERARNNKRTANHQKGETATRIRREQREQKASQRAAKGEESAFERAQALVVRTPGYAMRTVEQQTELMHGETTMIEQQGRKTIMEAIDQAQKLAGQAQQVSACSIRASANLAQDWLTMTWHLWDTATETMRSVMRGETGAGQRDNDRPTA